MIGHIENLGTVDSFKPFPHERGMMMTKQNYEILARAMGSMFAIAHHNGGEELRTAMYDAVYSPLVIQLEGDNPSFDSSVFAFAAASQEHRYTEGLRFAPKVTSNG